MGMPAGPGQEADYLLRVGERVRIRRKACGFSQEKLAELADVSLNTIRRIESKHKSTGLLTYFLIAGALKMPLSELLAADEGGDHRLEEMSAAWYSVQQERDRQIIYVTYMAMVSAVQDGTYLI